MLLQTQVSATLDTASQVIGSFADLAKAQGASFDTMQSFAAAQTLIDTLSAAQKAYLSMAAIPIVGPGLGVVAAGAALVAGYARYQEIKKAKPARFGMDEVISEPTNISVAEGGAAERVQVTPLEGPNVMGPAPQGNVQISLSGNVMSKDFVENELAEQIRESVRQGMDLGI